MSSSLSASLFYGVVVEEADLGTRGWDEIEKAGFTPIFIGQDGDGRLGIALKTFGDRDTYVPLPKDWASSPASVAEEAALLQFLEPTRVPNPVIGWHLSASYL